MGKVHTDDVGVIDIWSKGFGLLPKLLMVDPGLSLGAKALAAYFYAHSGAEKNTVYPTRDTILKQLQIDKEAYYKYLKELTDSGIVSVTRAEKAHGGYAHNIYALAPLPMRYQDPQQFKGFTKKLVKKAQKSGNIIAAGYGRIPGAVMTSGIMSWKAKALYAYLCMFADTSLLVLPERTSTIKDLGISASTYERYLRELRAHECISYETCQDHGRFCGTKIDLNPSKEDKQMSDEQSAPHGQVSDIQDHDERNMPCRQKPDMQNPDELNMPRRQKPDTHNPDERNMPRRQKPDMQNPDEQSSPDGQASDTQKPDTIIPPFLTRPPFDNQSISPARTRVEGSAHTEGEIDPEAILAEMADYGGLPYEYCDHRAKLEAAIALLTEADKHMQNPDPYESELYKLFTSALAEMLDTNAPDTSIRKATLSVIKIYKEFSRAVEAGYDDYGVPYAVAPQLYVGTRHRYIQATAKNPPKHRLNYMKAVIWTELTTAELEIQEQIAHDFADEGD